MAGDGVQVDGSRRQQLPDAVDITVRFTGAQIWRTTGAMTDEDLPASEAARARRRDRDMEAERRALLRPGMAKVFRQVTEAAAKPPKPKQRKAKRSKT